MEKLSTIGTQSYTHTHKHTHATLGQKKYKHKLRNGTDRPPLPSPEQTREHMTCSRARRVCIVLLYGREKPGAVYRFKYNK